MKQCPSCEEDIEEYIASSTDYYEHLSLDKIWDCPVCWEFFGQYYLLNIFDICWYPKVHEVLTQFPELLEIKSGSTHEDLVTKITCLCCDALRGNCQADVNDWVLEESVDEYISAHKIATRDIYEIGASDCTYCEHFKADGCVPLRNMIRIGEEIGQLPAFTFYSCKYYKQDNFVTRDMDFDDKNDFSIHTLYP